MTALRLPLALALFALAALDFAPADDKKAKPPAFSAAQVAFYEKEVRPVLARNCLKCHGDDPTKLKGGLNLSSRSGTLAGGDSGPAVDLAKPADSLLVKAIHYKDENYQMPPKGKLPDADIATLTKWVADGLPVSAGHMGRRRGQAAAEGRRYRRGEEVLGVPTDPPAGGAGRALSEIRHSHSD